MLLALNRQKREQFIIDDEGASAACSLWLLEPNGVFFCLLERSLDRERLINDVEIRPPQSQASPRRAPDAAVRPRGSGPKWDGYETFTIGETAEIVGISKGSAYAAAGTLPTISFGRRKIVPPALFEKLLGYR
jgi:hypothetical protein